MFACLIASLPLAAAPFAQDFPNRWPAKMPGSGLRSCMHRLPDLAELEALGRRRSSILTTLCRLPFWLSTVPRPERCRKSSGRLAQAIRQKHRRLPKNSNGWPGCLAPEAQKVFPEPMRVITTMRVFIPVRGLEGNPGL